MLLLNGTPIERFNFPNNETGIKLPEVKQLNLVTLYYESDQDLFDLILLRQHFKNIPGEYLGIDLTISYMPYSRMDRANKDYLFSLKSVCELINWLKFDIVYVVEPHSDVTCALLDRSKPIWVIEHLLPEVFDNINFDPTCDYLVFPDAGAQKRYEKINQYNYYDKIGTYNILVGIKERDFTSGHIEGYHMVTIEGAGLFRGRKALIVDDLCSGGRTFVEASKALKSSEYGFEEVHLLVAHVENNIYNGEIFDHVSSVHGTTSLQRESQHEQLYLYALDALLEKIES